MIVFPRNSKEELRLTLDLYRGMQLINFRVWYRADDGEMRPGRQGVAFKREMLPEIIEALERFKEGGDA